MKAGVEILGMNELKAILRELPEKLGTRILVRALVRSAAPMYVQAVRNAPRRTGRTQTAIRTKPATQMEPAVYIAPTTGKGANADAWYAKFHEFGTKGFGKRKRVTAGMGVNLKTGGYYAKKQTTGYKKAGTGLPALHFMLRAFEEKSEQSLGMVAGELSKIIVPYLKRKAPRYYAA
jgi:HK97 gp10 family phage protein